MRDYILLEEKGTVMRKTICLWVTALLMSLAIVGCGMTTQKTPSIPTTVEQANTVTGIDEQSTDKIDNTLLKYKRCCGK